MARNYSLNVSDESSKKKERFKLKKSFVEYSWYLDPMPPEYADKYMSNFVLNQALINEIMSFLIMC